MTTIVYSKGLMVSDRRAYSGDRAGIGSKTKIFRLADGSLFGVSSATLGASQQLREWIEKGAPLPENGEVMQPEKFELLLVKPTGDVYYAHDCLALVGPLKAEFHAIGSGAEYAKGALAMGATPEGAVTVACELDIWSGGGMDLLLLERPQQAG